MFLPSFQLVAVLSAGRGWPLFIGALRSDINSEALGYSI